jgi:hypothetical protein
MKKNLRNKHGYITLDFELDGPQNFFPLLSKASSLTLRAFQLEWQQII